MNQTISMWCAWVGLEVIAVRRRVISLSYLTTRFQGVLCLRGSNKKICTKSRNAKNAPVQSELFAHFEYYLMDLLLLLYISG